MWSQNKDQKHLDMSVENFIDRIIIALKHEKRNINFSVFENCNVNVNKWWSEEREVQFLTK